MRDPGNEVEAEPVAKGDAQKRRGEKNEDIDPGFTLENRGPRAKVGLL